MALRRYYIETADVSGATESQVALAEELIDRYVGPQPKYLHRTIQGRITSLLNSFKTIVDDGSETSGQTQLDATTGMFKNAVLEMLSGSAAGKRGVLETSDKDAKSVTLRAALATNPAVGDYFKIYQLGKFPRTQDVFNTPDGLNVYPAIPELVREAVVAQVQYIIAKGDGYFVGDSSEMKSESFLNYSYTRSGEGSGGSSMDNLISPQAKAMLRGIMNRKGRMLEGPVHDRREFI